MKTVPLYGAISLILILLPGTAKTIRRSKRSNAANFNVLLSIYKMNPLKHSNVFKAFSNRILLPGPDDRRAAMNFNSNESREGENGTNTKLKNMEVINHATHKPADHPLYAEEETPEKFEPGHFLSRLVSMNQIDIDLKRNDDSDIFNDDIVQTDAVQLKSLKNYVNKAGNNINRNGLQKNPKMKGNLKVLSIVNNKMPSSTSTLFDVEETLVI